MVFDFPAKSGQRRVQSIRDPEVKAAIEAMRRRRSGPDDLLVYSEDGLARRPLRRRQRLHAGRRGVHGQGLPHLARHRARRGRAGAAEAPSSKGGRARDPRAVKRVAERLGNTPAVCRSSYIDPRVLDRFRDGKTIELPGIARRSHCHAPAAGACRAPGLEADRVAIGSRFTSMFAAVAPTPAVHGCVGLSGDMRGVRHFWREKKEAVRRLGQEAFQLGRALLSASAACAWRGGSGKRPSASARSIAPRRRLP